MKTICKHSYPSDICGTCNPQSITIAAIEALERELDAQLDKIRELLFAIDQGNATPKQAARIVNSAVQKIKEAAR